MNTLPTPNIQPEKKNLRKRKYIYKPRIFRAASNKYPPTKS